MTHSDCVKCLDGICHFDLFGSIKFDDAVAATRRIAKRYGVAQINCEKLKKHLQGELLNDPDDIIDDGML